MKKSRTAITPPDYAVLAVLRHGLRCFLRFSQAAAEAAGLTPRQHQALLAIKGHPGRAGLAVGELAERLELRHHSAVELVDRRRVEVGLTARGETLIRRLSAAHRAERRQHGPELHRLLGSITRV